MYVHFQTRRQAPFRCLEVLTMQLTISITEQEAGRAVLSLLRYQMGLSAALIRRLKQAQAIFVNGVCQYTNYKVSAGDTLTVDLSLCPEPCGLVPETGPLDILYEDDWFLAANKPAGLLVHPSRSKYTGTLANFVTGYLGAGCHCVNRLDRDTSGVVLFAKNAHAKARAIAALQAPEAKKTYLALVCGAPEGTQGTIDLPILRAEPQKMRRIVDPAGARAVTHWRLVRQLVGYALLECALETGRTHQIRVHCLAMGFPILGDGLYNTPASLALSQKLGIEACALHAYALQFRDPFSGNMLYISAPADRFAPWLPPASNPVEF